MFEPGSCIHICDTSLHQNDFERLRELTNIKGVECAVCGTVGQLWLCLDADCLALVCSAHSLPHYRVHPSHDLQLCLATLRLWCYACDRQPPLAQAQPSSTRPPGVVGLQNVGNTCYANAALQALSSTPALTQFFLSRPVPPMHTRPTISQSSMTEAFHRFLSDIWATPAPTVIQPSHVLYAIRNSHPMFRGYQQHDTQEFLRCLMDQLHEEMKVPRLTSSDSPILGVDSIHVSNSMTFYNVTHFNLLNCDGAGSGSQSEAEEYETCDSGVSERSSLSEETSSSKNRSSRSSSPERVRLKQLITSLKTTKKHTSYRSIISDVFDGKLLSSVQCLTCNRLSNRVETFQDLSLPIPSRDHLQLLHQGGVNSAKCAALPPADQGWLWWLWDWVCSLFWGPTVSLHDCLAAFFSADELKGDNMYSCDKCKKLRNGMKYSRVIECPEVLCIHLKRIRHELMFSSKIGNHVSFPLTGLDMRPFLHNKESSAMYNLASIICHYGPAAGGGHYTCLSLCSADQRWYEYDDQCVRPVSPETVRASPAYVLFYRKDNSEMDKVRRKCSHLEESNPMASRYLVAKDWMTRFRTMSEPGPVDNRPLICPHGMLSLEEYCTVSTPVWKYIMQSIGGGPAILVNELEPCQHCNQPELSLLHIQLLEFHRLKASGDDERYAISARWMTRWDEYARNASTHPPGPIDNNNIMPSDNFSGEQFVEVTRGQWDMLVGLYGGGPPVLIRDSAGESDTLRCEELLSHGDNVDSGCWFSGKYAEQNEGSKNIPVEENSIQLEEVTSSSPLP